MKRTLYLKVVPKHLVEQMWNLKELLFTTNIITLKRDKIPHVVVRCNKKGIINWDNTGVYTFDELIGKKIQFVK